MTLVLDRRGMRVEMVGNGVVAIRSPDRTAQRVGLHALRSIIVHGDVALSSRLLRACHELGVGVMLVSTRGAQQVVHVLPGRPLSIRLRRAQYQHWADPRRRLERAVEFVAWKIERQGEVLESCGLEANLEHHLRQALSASTMESLRGTEGASSARYYGAWKKAWVDPWRFPKRTRRPPADPVNALLSLGYTLATHHVGRIAALHGFDLALGFLHEGQNNRPALALDLVEPLRPLVDDWVWHWFRHSPDITPDNFRHDGPGGVRLDKPGRGRFYGAWFGSGHDWLEGPARDIVARLMRTLREAGRIDNRAVSG